MDWTGFRAQFPALDTVTYLITGGGAPLSRAAAAAGRAYYHEAEAGGDTHWNTWLARTDAARATVGRYFNVEPQTIGFIGNASEALDIAERLLGDRGGALALVDDFPSLTFPWLNRGRPVRFVPSDPDGRPRFEAVTSADLQGIGTLLIGHIHYRTGYRVDLDQAAAFAARHNLELVIDATQSVGVFDLDVARLDPALVTFSAYKWVGGGYGTGAVYVRPALLTHRPLPVAGWRSAAVPYSLTTDQFTPGTATSVLEQGHPPFAPIFALGAGLELIERTGRVAVRERVLALAAHLRAGLLARGRDLISTRDPNAVTGIVVASTPAAEAVQASLRAQGILISRFGQALRISVHAYSTEAEIDRALDAWDAVEPVRSR